jgi:hypothetical protein
MMVMRRTPFLFNKKKRERRWVVAGIFPRRSAGTVKTKKARQASQPFPGGGYGKNWPVVDASASMQIRR